MKAKIGAIPDAKLNEFIFPDPGGNPIPKSESFTDPSWTLVGLAEGLRRPARVPDRSGARHGGRYGACRPDFTVRAAARGTLGWRDEDQKAAVVFNSTRRRLSISRNWGARTSTIWRTTSQDAPPK